MLASLWISDLPPEELGEQSHKIESVTLEDVEKASRKYFPIADDRSGGGRRERR